jgi:hypothetical protein
VVSDFEKRFGTMAVEKEYVTKEQLLEAMRIQVEQDLDGIEHRLIGSILFSMGYLTLEQVNEVIEAIKEDAATDDPHWQWGKHDLGMKARDHEIK